MDGMLHTVLGVMPAGFAQPAPTDVWLPFDIPPSNRTAVLGKRSLTVGQSFGSWRARHHRTSSSST